MIVLDTDVCIEILHGNPTVCARLEACGDEVAVAGMTAAELFYGAEKSAKPNENRMRVERFLSAVPVLPLDENTIRTFGSVKACLSGMGCLIPDADLLIAATALSRFQPLATGNTSHFRRVFGLRLENWRDA